MRPVRPLPSLNALRAFEAAGRHLSFTRAAEELNVTPAAVGQQVRGLEDVLGTPLLLRVNRSLSLTEAGRAYSLEGGSIDIIDELNELNPLAPKRKKTTPPVPQPVPPIGTN